MRASGGHTDCQEVLYRTVFRRNPQIKLGGRLTNRRLGCHPCHSPESMTLSQAP